MQVTYTLLPGLHGNASLFSSLTKELDVPAIEYVEYPTDIPQTYDDLEEFLIDRLDWQKPRVLIAENFSGPLAMRLANRLPTSIHSLVLAATFCTSPTSPQLALLPLRSLLMLSPPKRALRHFLVGEDASDSILAELKQTITEIPTKILSQRVRAILSLEEADCPDVGKTPTLILQASYDNMIPWERQNQLRTRYAHATTHWVDAPHLLLQHAPKECAAVIKEFSEQHIYQLHYA